MRATRSVLIATLVASLTAAVPATPHARAADGVYYLQSATTGLNAGASGTSVLERRPKGDEDHQQWTLAGRTLREGTRCLGRRATRPRWCPATAWTPSGTWCPTADCPTAAGTGSWSPAPTAT